MTDRTVSSLPPRSRAASTTSPGRAGRRRLLRGDESGAVLVEFALVVPILVLFMYGIIFFGMLLATKQTLTSTAADAARSAIGAVAGPAGGGPAGETEEEAAIRVARASILSRLGTLYDSPEPAVIHCEGATGPKCIKVVVQRNDPPVPPAPGLGVLWDDSNRLVSTALVQI